jgi:lysosomal acid lipase/cholesteryl ester hydrolase
MVERYVYVTNTLLKSYNPTGGYYICRDESLFQELCANVLFLIGGFNSEQLNRTILPAILQNTPAGSSVQQLTHYGHGVNSGKFRMYDLGLIGNMNKYGQASPPEYQLNKISSRVFLHYGDYLKTTHFR